MDDILSHEPTEGLCYDPDQPLYWQLAPLDLEVTRTFEVCQACRRCEDLCATFPTLYGLIDGAYDGDAQLLTTANVNDVFDPCFSCQQCVDRCPYSVQAEHALQIDVPSLIVRYRAVRAREQGLTFLDRVLGTPHEFAGTLRSLGGLVDRVVRSTFGRRVAETLTGLSRSHRIAEPARESFESWARREGATRSEGEPDVVIFATCTIDQFAPEVGRDAIDVLARNGVRAQVVTGAGCCGRAAWEAGDFATLRRLATTMLDRLAPHAEAGRPVMVLQPGCVDQLRRTPTLIGDPRAERLAEAVVDPGDWLAARLAEGTLDTGFSSAPTDHVALQQPCPSRLAHDAGPGFSPVLEAIPGMTVTTVAACCGQGVTHGVPTAPLEAAEDAEAALRSTGATTWTTACRSAALRLAGADGVPLVHPLTLLAQAYRGERS